MKSFLVGLLVGLLGKEYLYINNETIVIIAFFCFVIGVFQRGGEKIKNEIDGAAKIHQEAVKTLLNIKIKLMEENLEILKKISLKRNIFLDVLSRIYFEMTICIEKTEEKVKMLSKKCFLKYFYAVLFLLTENEKKGLESLMTSLFRELE